MTIRNTFPYVLASLGLAVFAPQTQAAGAFSHMITPAQVEQLQVGASQTDITQQLGAPEYAARWMDHTSSLVYAQDSPYSDYHLVYVNFDQDGKLKNVEIIELTE